MSSEGQSVGGFFPPSVFGFRYDEIALAPGDTDEKAIEVHLREHGGDVILTQTEFQQSVRDADSPESFVTNVLSFKAEAGKRWERERGPNSELGRNMEAGTPSSTREE
jgi:hypothetical protein